VFLAGRRKGERVLPEKIDSGDFAFGGLERGGVRVQFSARGTGGGLRGGQGGESSCVGIGMRRGEGKEEEWGE